MDAVSMALNPIPVANMSKVMLDSSAKAHDLANKMLTAGLELKLKGLEMGKGSLIDVAG